MMDVLCAASTVPSRPGSATRSLVAVVDASDDLLTLYGEVLGEAGFDTFLTTVLPDQVALAALRPAALVLDLQVGSRHADGLAYLARVRDHPLLAETPVVVCTGAAHLVRTHEPALRAWGVTVVAKPFDLDLLLAAVEEAVADRACLQEESHGDGA
jgi:DNA-binding NtrC family response regulator